MDPRSVALICITAVVCAVILASAIASRIVGHAGPFGMVLLAIAFFAAIWSQSLGALIVPH
jgi:hypothetical protein